MRSRVGVLAALVVLLAGPALAKTQQEELEAALKKHATDVGQVEKNRSACVCLDGSSINLRAGWLRRELVFPNRFAVSCLVLGFDSAGNVNSATSTCALYAVLPK